MKEQGRGERSAFSFQLAMSGLNADGWTLKAES